MSQRRLRVLYVNHVAMLGGAERSLLVLLEALDREAVAPVLAAPEGPLLEQARRLGVECHAVTFGRVRRRGPWRETARSAWRILSASWRLRRLAVGADVVHANSAATALSVRLMLPTLGRRPTFIWHVRDLVWPPGLVPLVAQRLDRAIAISRAVARKLRRYGVSGSCISVLANALNPQRFEPQISFDETRIAAGIPVADVEKAYVFATVGYLIPWKGHDLLLEAFAKVAVRHAGTYLMIVGDDPFAEHREYVAGLHARCNQPDLRGRVLWMGRSDSVPDLLQAADVLVLSSYGEPFGRVLLEAMAMDIPIVATAGGGTPDVVRTGVNGLLVPEGDADALAGAMLRLMAMPLAERQALGIAGYNVLRRAFAAESHAAAVVTVYRRMLASTAGG